MTQKVKVIFEESDPADDLLRQCIIAAFDTSTADFEIDLDLMTVAFSPDIPISQAIEDVIQQSALGAMSAAFDWSICMAKGEMRSRAEVDPRLFCALGFTSVSGVEMASFMVENEHSLPQQVRNRISIDFGQAVSSRAKDARYGEFGEQESSEFGVLIAVMSDAFQNYVRCKRTLDSSGGTEWN